jgi:hypothetical protein
LPHRYGAVRAFGRFPSLWISTCRRELALIDAMRTWEQLIGVKSLEQAVEIQSQYAKRVYDNHMAELSKLGEMCVGMARDASKPIQETSKRFTSS